MASNVDYYVKEIKYYVDKYGGGAYLDPLLADIKSFVEITEDVLKGITKFCGLVLDR